MRGESIGNTGETGVVDPLGDEEPLAPEDELEPLAEEFGDESLDELEELEELEEVEALEEEAEMEAADRTTLLHPAGVPQRRPDEFVCRSCFLLKHLRLLADEERQICRDCAA